MGKLYDFCAKVYARKMTLICVCTVGSEKFPALEEIDGEDKELTEEEWSRRVAELNKHQVTISNDLSLHVS